MRSAGLVSIDVDRKWVGARYYLQHLVRCVAALGPDRRVPLRDVWWNALPEEDDFAEVRELLGPPAVVAPPRAWPERIARKLRSAVRGTRGAGDLFLREGIDVLYPIPPCENPGIPYVFWLPDFQYLRRPDLMGEQRCAEVEAYFRAHVAAAARVVLSSEDARRDFAKVFPQAMERSHVVRFCSVPDADWWSLDPLQTARAKGLPARFFIVCNQFTRHKNHLTLVEALALLARRGLGDVHLVCTGSSFDHRGEGYAERVAERAEALGVRERLHILGLVPRAEQIALLRQSVAVLQPSWFEGWSTIIEDAKSIGKLVLASALPVHREQLGDEHPFLLDLEEPEAWADAMAQAWAQRAGGVDADGEARARQLLGGRMHDCGASFADALRAAR